MKRNERFFKVCFFVGSAVLFLNAPALSAEQSYTGPLFDAMAQIDHKVDFNNAMVNVRQAGVKKIALFARSLKKLGQNEQALINLRDRNPDLLVLGAPKYFPLQGDLDPSYISATIHGIETHGYAFIGEICYSHADKSVGNDSLTGERYVDPSSQGTAELLKCLANKKVPLMTHWEVYAWERDWPRFNRLYAEYPDQVFILPHMAFGSVEQVRTIFGKHPNVYMTLSKKEKRMTHLSDRGKAKKLGPGMLNENDGIKQEWRDLLIEYQDRILFATDAHMRRRWKKYSQHIRTYRSLLGQFQTQIADKIAYRNAEKLYGVRIDAMHTQSRVE